MLLAELTTADYWIIVCAVATVLISLAALAVSVFVASRKQEVQLQQPVGVSIDGEPTVKVRAAAKRYNHEATEHRFSDIDRRLNGHDEELKTIQKDRAKTLEHINGRFERILVGVSNIAGRVGAKMPPEERDSE